VKPKRLGVASRSGYALPKRHPQPLILVDADALILVVAGHPTAAWGLRIAAWSVVLIPLAWGGWFTVQKAAVLLAQ
jgi:hypothetical protein